MEQIASDRHQVTVHHEAIPGYMIEMTMAFPVNDTKELDGISPGDKITFTLVVDKDQDWVNNIRRIGHVEPNMDNVMFMTGDVPSKLKPGDKLPDSELVAEDGRHIHLSDFRGKVVAFTFFFTRCPLPTYCPLMNRNFAQTRSLLLSNPKGPTNWEFLSISFDPDFDRPETLSSYARFYRGDNADRWLFADAPSDTLADLGSRLGLMVMRQDASITHNLRTVVIDPQGRLYRQFNDNQWTPRQLADAMLEAAQLPSSK
ncbi:MAG: copper-binding protein [Methylacidiphilales bacterium]|nr:copper-binding protein [Candidatus Methylacidiphilales bacterium]